MGADTRAFQETFRYKHSSVRFSCLELKFCACSGRQICWQTFCKKKKKALIQKGTVHKLSLV